MPLHVLPNQTNLVVCGLSGKRYSGVAELHDFLKPLLPDGVVLIPRDGLCSAEALNRYVRWACACFFIRVEAPDSVREAKGWKEKFGPDDLVRDEHWTELALDDWDGWDAVVHHNGDSFALQAEAQRLAIRVSDLRRSPELSQHRAVPEAAVKQTEFTTPMPECMKFGGAEAYVPSTVAQPSPQQAAAFAREATEDLLESPGAKEPLEILSPPPPSRPAALACTDVPAAQAQEVGECESAAPVVAELPGDGELEMSVKWPTSSEWWQGYGYGSWWNHGWSDWRSQDGEHTVKRWAGR